MLVALVVVSLLLVALAVAVTWEVFEIATLKRDKAGLSDVDSVAAELEALSNIVQRSTGRVSSRLEKASSDIRSASESDVRIQAQLTRLAAEVASLKSSLQVNVSETQATRLLVDQSIADSMRRLDTLAQSINGGITTASSQFINVQEALLSG